VRTSKPPLLSRNRREASDAPGRRPTTLLSPLTRPRTTRDQARYDAKPDRPTMQLVVRAGLWAALVVGCLGGLVALLRPTGDDGAAPAATTDDRAMVPAQVAGVAERTVEGWLTASDAERRELDELFAEPLPVTEETADDGGGLAVEAVTTVAGQRLDDGYWSVTVVAELAGSGAEAPVDLEDAAGAEETAGAAPSEPSDAATGQTTWFVEIGIVDDGGGGYVALSTPAVLPSPPGDDPAWAVPGTRAAVDPDDPMAELVERFLAALLTGAGDAGPYLAPGVELPVADPPPFAELELVELASEELDDGQVWVSAQVLATTADGGATLPTSYDLVLVPRSDRWEVVELSGVPTLIE